MIQKLKLTILSLSFLLTSMLSGASLFTPATALALNCDNPQTQQERLQCGVCLTDPQNCPNPDPGKGLGDFIRKVVNVISILAGAVAVIMIIFGGFRYVTSAGNPENIKNARNTIIYALIGLVIIALAQLLVHFTIDTVS